MRKQKEEEKTYAVKDVDTETYYRDGRWWTNKEHATIFGKDHAEQLIEAMKHEGVTRTNLVIEEIVRTKVKLSV